MEKDPALKGVFGKNCNRTACQRPEAVWYNHSTRKYYCEDCATELNRCNRRDALELFGHDLCTLELTDGLKKSLIGVQETDHTVTFVIVDEILLREVFGKKVFTEYTPENSKDAGLLNSMRHDVFMEFILAQGWHRTRVSADYQRSGLPLTKVAYLYQVERGEWLSRECGQNPAQYGPGVWCVVNECFCDPNCGMGEC